MNANHPQFSRRLILQSMGLGACAATWPLGAMAQLQVDILGVGASQYPVAIQPFVGAALAPENISAIIGNDLVRSGAFRLTGVLPQAPELDATPDWKQLSADGALADAVGSLTELPDGRWEVHYRLYDVVKKSEIDQFSWNFAAEDLRMCAHKIADRIYERLTGEKGIFASRIAYVSQQGPRSYQLMIADSDGHNPKAALRSREPLISPAWSPDGRRLAYTTFETGKPTVWVQDLVTGKRRAVAAFKGSNSAPAWSPDGHTLAVSLSKDGSMKLYLIDVDSGAVRPFTTGESIDTEPAFSPDGQTIYFTSDRGGTPQIYRQQIGSNQAQRVSFGSNYAISPAVSPKGDMLAYIVRSGGNFQLVEQDLQTGNVIPLSQVGKNESPSFAPNGNMIIYASETGGRGVLSTVSSDGSARSRLTGQSGDIREPAWGPVL